MHGIVSVNSIGLALACFLSSCCTNTARVDQKWDFTNSHTLADANIGISPQDEPDKLFEFDNVRNLTAYLPDDQVFESRVRKVYVKRDGDTANVYWVAAHLDHMSLENVKTEAEYIAEQFMPQRGASLEEWYQHAKAANGYVVPFELNNNASNPAYSLRIGHSFDSSRPWCIIIQVGWTRAEDAVSRTDGSFD